MILFAVTVDNEFFGSLSKYRSKRFADFTASSRMDAKERCLGQIINMFSNERLLWQLTRMFLAEYVVVSGLESEWKETLTLNVS